MKQESKTLYLLPESNLKSSGKFLEYSLGTWDVDDLSNYNEVFDLSLCIMSDVLKECIVISPIMYTMAKLPQKRFFLPDVPPKFFQNSLTDSIITAINEKKVDLAYFIKEYAKKSGWFKHYYKSLYVMSREANMQLLDFLSGRSHDESKNSSSGLTIYGYLKIDAPPTQLIEDYVNDLINPNDYLECPNYAISFFIERYHNMLQITLNPAKMPVDVLLKSIKLHAGEHNFELEVQL